MSDQPEVYVIEADGTCFRLGHKTERNPDAVTCSDCTRIFAAALNAGADPRLTLAAFRSDVVLRRLRRIADGPS